MEILWSARKHGVDGQDIDHALAHVLVSAELSEDPARTLHIGPDRAANLLELVVIERLEGLAVIHAMPLRPRYRYLLEGERS